MKQFKLDYYGYELSYYLQPGTWMEQSELTALRRELKGVNVLAKKDFNYGLFDESRTEQEHKEFLAMTNLCVIREKGRAVGFFYNLILQLKPNPVVHAGLVVIGQNKGIDLMGYAYSWLAILQFRKFGAYFYTNISSTPSIVGIFSDSFSKVWPNYKGNQLKPPSKDYVQVLDVLNENYIQKYFGNDGCSIDKRRFVLTSPSSEMGFETNLKKLSRYIKPEVNYFCMFWLDYSKGEDLIQVGRVDFRVISKLTFYYGFKRAVNFMRSSENQLRPRKLLAHELMKDPIQKTA